jgi:hypothetical protein
MWAIQHFCDVCWDKYVLVGECRHPQVSWSGLVPIESVASALNDLGMISLIAPSAPKHPK